MKRLISNLIIGSLCVLSLNAQNTYDMYNVQSGVYSAMDPTISGAGLPITSGGFGSYTGEYQIFFNEHPWENYGAMGTFNNNAISYKIETVSFPFTPNCINCQTFFTGAAALDPTKRVLKMPDEQFTYDVLQKAWVRDITGFPPPTASTSTNDFLLRREFNGQYGIGSSAAGINGDIHWSTLASKGIVGDAYPNDESHAIRVYYPHTILKHTFYMHCGNSITDEIVDSMTFIIDNTRGRMRYYPFKSANTSTMAFEHDVTIVPKWQDPSTFTIDPNTIEYFPIPFTSAVCQNHFPSGVNWDADYYIRPQPNTLVQYYIGNNIGNAAAGYSSPSASISAVMGGIKQDYLIDRSIDLTLFNPSEKIIYNPSEVTIDLNQTYNTTPASRILTFPSGYVFKTVSGLYPTATQVYAADPNGLYNHPQDIPYVTTLTDDPSTVLDERASYYYVENGSMLNIEPCVGIYDAVIIVKSGGTVNYDPQQTYGNYSIRKETPTCLTCIINPVIQPTVNCAHDCYTLAKYDKKDIVISSPTTWNYSATIPHPLDINTDGKLTIAGNITILANQTLTINGAYTYEFGENAGIVIQRGAQLIVNGATFTSADICQKGMWNGMEVWGNRNVQQGASIGFANQGVVNLTNVTIKNARNAIATIRTGANWDYYGGIVRCTNVIFENNRTAVGFLSYHNIPSPGLTELKNFSYLKNCQFLITNYLNDPKYKTSNGRRLGNIAQVTMWDVKDVTITGCIFENSAVQVDGITPLFETDIRGVGIYAIDAGIRMAGPLTNQFKGLSDGIWALSSGESDLIWIESTNFKNNVHGLTLEGIQSPIINLNTFEIPIHYDNTSVANSVLQKGYNKPTGLYFIGTTNFTAQENKFTNYSTITTSAIPTQDYNYGMVVNNCSGSLGDGLGYAYKNTFSNVNVNLQTELDNRGGFTSGFPNSGGLEYKCNEFNTRISFDVTVPDGVGISSLIRDQGLCNDPFNPANSNNVQAGNSYTGCSGLSELEFDPLSQFDNSSFQYNDQASVFSFACTNIATPIPPCNPLLGPNSCPSNFSICATIPCLTLAFTNAELAAKQILASYKLLLDGGNTAFLLSKINSSMAPGTLKNLLISKSPYLSDAVLIAMLNRANPLPPGHIKQIIIANSPVTAPVLTAVQNAGLPSGILNNILAAQVGISVRTEKEKEVNYYAFQANLAKINLKQGYYKIENIDSVKAISQKDSTLSGLFKQIEILISQNNYTAAHLCLNKIHVAEGSTHLDRCKLNGIRLYLAENNKSWFDMTPAQATVIQQIYNNNPETAIEARSILALTKALVYDRYPFDIQTTRSMSVGNSEVLEQAKTISGFKVYPNPSSDYLNVEIRLNESIKNAQLVVYDVLGSMITTQIVTNNEKYIVNANEYNNGIYFFILLTEAGVIEKEKIIITK